MDKKVVIVTGGGKGIGFEIALLFAKSNYNVVITGRTKETLDKAYDELKKYTDVLALVADGANEEDVNNVINKTIEKFKKINVLINNAQASKSGLKLIEHSKEDFDLAINTGIYATFFYMKNCFNYLKETKGSIINFVSSAGFFGKIGQSSYAASKEGIRGLSRVAATEFGEYSINVNCVAPLVETEQLKKWKEEYPDIYNQTIKNIPMNRFGTTNEVASLCLFLASDSAKYISGETISIQGGAGLRP